MNKTDRPVDEKDFQLVNKVTPDLEKPNVTSQEQFESVYKDEYNILNKHLKLFWIDSLRACEAMRELNSPLQKENERLKSIISGKTFFDENEAIRKELEEAKKEISIARNLITALNDYFNSISGRDVTVSNNFY